MKAVHAFPSRPMKASGLTRDQAAYALSLAILLAAASQQAVLGFNTDVSWLLTVAERMLDGDRLYSDILELNPPASVLLYLPWVALARLTGAEPEVVLALATFAFCLASIALSAAIFRSSQRVASLAPWSLPIAMSACLLVVGTSFGQREHFALLALLPWLALQAARMEGAEVSRRLALLAGACAGITACIKPHFGLAVALPVLITAWHRRSYRELFGPATWTCAAVLGTYAAATLLMFPDFTRLVLPLVGDGYLRTRLPLTDLLLEPMILLFLLAAIATVLVERDRRWSGSVAVPLAAAVGFVIAALVQGKGYANHLYPGTALALLALGMAVTRKERASAFHRSLFPILSGAAIFVAAHAARQPALTALVRQVAPPRPTIIVAGTNLAIGHPLTRQVGGRWVGSRGALWVTGTAFELLPGTSDAGRRTRLIAQVEEDRAIWVRDVVSRRPDVVLVDAGEGVEWIAAHPDVSAALRPYRRVGSADGVEIFLRQPNATGAGQRGSSGLADTASRAGTAETAAAGR